MEYKKIEINYQLCQLEELSEVEQMVVKKSIEATNTAYAKYSHFYVGAAALLNNGTVVMGSNQENAAFPSSLCAERTAVFAAQATYPNEPIKILAIAAKTDSGLLKDPITPCGACRQVLMETSSRYQKPFKVIMVGKEQALVLHDNRGLLPFAFDGSDLPE